MDMTKIIELAWGVFSLMVLIGGTIYWVLKKKFEDDFCKRVECIRMRESQQEDCRYKHQALTKQFGDYRHDIANELKEIKDMIKEIRGLVFDYINKR